MFLHLFLLLSTVIGTAPSLPSTETTLLRLVETDEDKCRQLAAKLATCRASGKDITLPDGTLAVAELFCRYARYDAGQEKLRDAALRSMQYLDRTLDTELKRAAEVQSDHAAYPVIPKWPSGRITWHEGGFWCGGVPLFLSGMNWDANEAKQEPALLRRLGFNLADGMLRGSEKPDGAFDDESFFKGDGAYLAEMARVGFPVDCLLDASPPRRTIDATPGMAQHGYGNGYNYVIEHPEAVRYRERYLDHFVPLYAAQPSFFSVDLSNEPAFQGPSDLMIAQWKTWLQHKYGNMEALNNAWGTHLDSFDAVQRYPSEPEQMRSQWDRAAVHFDLPGVRGMHYDWCVYNNERISDFFRAESDRIHAAAPQVATHVKAMMGLFFTGSTESRGWKMNLSYHTFGIDPELLAHSCSLLGGDLDLIDIASVEKPNRRFGSQPYVAGWLDAGMTADFLKSLAPDKPFYNSEFHVTEDAKMTKDPEGAEAHMRMALWLAHLHGMSANLTWYWGRDVEGAPSGQGLEWFTGSMLEQPWMLRAYVEETLNLRRFVRPVMAFSQAPRPVRLLYSEASAIQDVSYLDALRDSYEALNFLGVSIGFITERQLAEQGVLADTRLLLVPKARYVEETTVRALRAAETRGVKIGILGEESLTATPTGIPRQDAVVEGATHLKEGTPQEIAPQIDALIRAARIPRELEALDTAGHPAWGVEVRTAQEGDHRLAYLVNLRREPVTVTLRSRSGPTTLRDWRTDAQLPEKVTLAPRQVVFGTF